MSYSLRVLDLDRSVLAILDRVSNPTYTRKKREATAIVVTLPRGDQKLDSIQRGRFLEVWRNGVREASGRIELRDVLKHTVVVTAYTEEILLKDYITPAAYGAVLSNMDAIDVVKACIDGWHTVSIKSVEQWSTTVERNRVEPKDAVNGSLWLTRNASGQYQREGYAVYQFRAVDIPGFKSWERIRWSSDYPPDSMVFTTIQWREGTSGTWLPTTSWPSCTGGDCESPQTLRGERGVMPDQIGLRINSTAAVLQVRCNLYSDDQESKEEDEANTSGSSPRFFALEVIARTAGTITTGSLPASAGVTAKGINADSATAFDVIRQATEQANLDFEVTARQLSVAESFGTDLSGEVNLVTSETDTQALPLVVVPPGVRWEQGTLSSANGAESSAPNRARTVEFLPCPARPMRVLWDTSAGTEVVALFYGDNPRPDGSGYLFTSGWLTTSGQTVTPPAGTRYTRLVIGKVVNPANGVTLPGDVDASNIRFEFVQ